LEQPLLRTKISVPQIPAEFVHRHRLTALVGRGVRGPLTLVVAPAGYGKTSLLVEWAREAHSAVAWLNLDEDDNDLGRFFRYLVGALQTVESHLGEEALEFILSSRGSGLELGLTLLINDIASLQQELVLVLDEFHALENSSVLESMSFALRHLPHNLHLVIAARSEPALELGSLRAKGRVFELGVDDLRFSREEVQQFLEDIMGFRIPPDTLEALVTRTDGWITALQMAAISLRHESDPAAFLAHLQGNADYLVDYFGEEVLDRQPEEARQFLLRSSILDLLTGPLCEAVVRPDAKPGYGTVMLSRLERSNLFIVALDDKHEWFRYHHLFADFLRHVQAEINPTEIPELHKRAALWFEQNGDLDEAIRHALESGDREWAADLIERSALTLVNMGEFSVITRLLGRLPDGLIHRRPRLCLAYAWGAVFAYQLDLARYWLDDLVRTLDQLEGQESASSEAAGLAVADLSDGDLKNIRGGVALSQSALALLSGEWEQAARYSRQAAGFLPSDSPFVRTMVGLRDSVYLIFSGDTQKAVESLRETTRMARQSNNLLVMIVATCELADVQVMQGQLSQAWATLEKAEHMVVGPDGQRLSLAGFVDVGFGQVLLERGVLDEARTYLERGCAVTRAFWLIGGLDALASLARLYQAQDNVAESQAVLEEVSRMALGTESSQWDNTMVSALAVRLAVQRQDLAAAEQWWARGGFPSLESDLGLGDYPYHLYEYLLLTQARYLLVRDRDTGNMDDTRRAAQLLASLLPEAERLQRFMSRIEIIALQAVAQSALGDEEQAIATMIKALALAEPEGYRQIFVDERLLLSELLLQCRSAEPEPGRYLPSVAFIEGLLSACRAAPGMPPPALARARQRASSVTIVVDNGPLASLSPRELEVLSLIAEGKSNQEIAAELYLALNTVKRHAYNIYAKLGVTRRTHAVSKARQLGLIS